MINRQSAIEHFQSLGVHLSFHRDDESHVFGIQCRYRNVTDESLPYFQSFRDELTVVGLEGTQITDDGLQHLTNLPQLDNVDLTNTLITDAGLNVLSKVKSLEHIHIEGTKVTLVGVLRLRVALPRCEVVWDGD